MKPNEWGIFLGGHHFWLSECNIELYKKKINIDAMINGTTVSRDNRRHFMQFELVWWVCNHHQKLNCRRTGTDYYYNVPPSCPLVAPAGCCVTSWHAALSLSRRLIVPPLVVSSHQQVVAPSLGAALENFTRKSKKKFWLLYDRKKEAKKRHKAQFVSPPKSVISTSTDGGQYPPRVIILRCYHRILPALAT
jgi:hypothetical protein